MKKTFNDFVQLIFPNSGKEYSWTEIIFALLVLTIFILLAAFASN